MSTPRRPRLSRDDWLAAGLEALRADGPGALGAEPLARRLGTTKGSFYWHFTDVPSYSEALLALWQQAAQASLDTDAAHPAARLRACAQAIAAPEDSRAEHTEPAIRAWAATEPAAAKAVAATDAERLARIYKHLKSCGISNPDMARIVLAAAIGMQADDPPEKTRDAIGTLIDLMLALG